jgi:hypothetical protein
MVMHIGTVYTRETLLVVLYRIITKISLNKKSLIKVYYRYVLLLLSNDKNFLEVNQKKAGSL